MATSPSQKLQQIKISKTEELGRIYLSSMIQGHLVKSTNNAYDHYRILNVRKVVRVHSRLNHNLRLDQPELG